jgi:hypothetical protein
MASQIRPLNRPDGSTQVLRYRGLVKPASSGGEIPTPQPLSAFPKENGTFPGDTLVVTPPVVIPAPPNPFAVAPFFMAYPRFLLADPGDVVGVVDPAALANFRRRFPQFLYGDDSQLAAKSPHKPIPALNTDGVNDGELIINPCTWAQNIQVRSSIVDLNVIGQDIGMATQETDVVGSMDSHGVILVRDTLTGGLGLNTGLPVIIVPFRVLAQSNGQQQPVFSLQPFGVDITIEIGQSKAR